MSEEYKLLPRHVPMVYLTTSGDFGLWNAAIRRLVKGYGMGDALMFTVPRNQLEALKSRKAEVVEKEKIKHEKVEGSSSSSTEDKTVEPSPQGTLHTNCPLSRSRAQWRMWHL